MLEGGIKMIDEKEEEILKRYQFWKTILQKVENNDNIKDKYLNVCSSCSSCSGCESGGGGGGCSSCS